MKVTRQSRLTGQLNTLDLPITPEQILKFTAVHRAWAKQCFPDLNAEGIEFFITGITPEEITEAANLHLEEIFADEDEDLLRTFY